MANLVGNIPIRTGLGLLRARRERPSDRRAAKQAR